MNRSEWRFPFSNFCSDLCSIRLGVGSPFTTNESFSGWPKTFAAPRLCGAIVDRFTLHGTIIETGTYSYRLAHILAQQTPASGGSRSRLGLRVLRNEVPFSRTLGGTLAPAVALLFLADTVRGTNQPVTRSQNF